MSDYKRMLNVMIKVNHHRKMGIRHDDIPILAEAAVKTMYLIDEENERKNKPTTEETR